MKEHIAKLDGKNLKIAIVVSRFNENITKALLDGALRGLEQLGVNTEVVEVFWVPGAVEIPIITKKIALKKNIDAIICLGCVIRGATNHYDYVCSLVSNGLSNIALETSIPTVFGVLTCDTIEQAVERSGSKAGNKGYESAFVAVEMANLLESIS